MRYDTSFAIAFFWRFGFVKVLCLLLHTKD